MHAWKLRIAGTVLLLATVAVGLESQAQPTPGGTALYEGARLIFGDDRPALDNGAFVVTGGRITAIGRAGEITAPAGAARVDLTGKTVMPALVNIHSHYGYEKFLKAEGESRAENFTAENLLDHLQREAYFGVGSVLDGGSGALAITQPFQAAQLACRTRHCRAPRPSKSSSTTCGQNSSRKRVRPTSTVSTEFMDCAMRGFGSYE